MWLVLFSCLSPAGLDRLPQDVAGTDTASTDRPVDDSGVDASGDDSGADDSAPVGLDDTAVPGTDDTSGPDASDCDWMTWHNVGEPFFTTWCTACHSSELESPDEVEKRQGAPVDCNLDSYAGVVAKAPDIQAKLMAGSMPPTGTPSADSKSAVLQWLECGAPE